MADNECVGSPSNDSISATDSGDSVKSNGDVNGINKEDFKENEDIVLDIGDHFLVRRSDNTWRK